jgi:transposase
MDLLRLHQARLHAWIPDTVETRRLQILAEYRRKLVHGRVRHTNRITSLLKMYFPQALDWAGELGTLQSCDFLQNWPTLSDIQQADPTQLRDFYRQHHCRRSALVDQRIAQIAEARCLTDDPAIVQSLSMAVQAEAAQLRPLIQAIARFDEVIAEQLSRHPLHTLFESFPGAGPVYIPRLLAAFGEDRSRWGSSAEFLCHSGIAPVTKKSGKSRLVHRRLACSNFIRQTFQEFAAQSIYNPRHGPELVTIRCALEAFATLPLSAPWLTNGSGSCTAAGWTQNPMMRKSILLHFEPSIPHCSRNFLNDQTGSDVRLAV